MKYISCRKYLRIQITDILATTTQMAGIPEHMFITIQTLTETYQVRDYTFAASYNTIRVIGKHSVRLHTEKRLSIHSGKAFKVFLFKIYHYNDE